MFKNYIKKCFTVFKIVVKNSSLALIASVAIIYYGLLYTSFRPYDYELRYKKDIPYYLDIEQCSKKFNIPEHIIMAFILTESCTDGINTLDKNSVFRINPKAKSSSNCLGVLQVSKEVLYYFNKANNLNIALESLYYPDICIIVGSWHIASISHIIEWDSWDKLYLAYNFGTAGYKRIMRNKENYKNYMCIKRFNKCVEIALQWYT